MSARRTSWTASDLLAETFPPPRFAVPGFVTEGLNLFAGPPKLGKSRMCIGLVVAVATGGTAFGKVACERGGAVYLALEDPPRRLQERLRDALRGTSVPDGLSFETAWPALNQGGDERLDTALANSPDTRLVVIDVFEKVRGPVTDRASIYGQDYTSMSTLKEIADRHRVAVVVVHHVRKAASEDFVNTVSGTHGLAGAADTILVVSRARNSTEAKLAITGRDLEEAEHALRYDATGGGWMLTGPASDYDLTDERRRVLHLLRDNARPMTPKEIALALGAENENTIRQLVRRMHAKGQLDTDSGRYSPATSLSLRSPESLLSDSGDRSDKSAGVSVDDFDDCIECGAHTLLDLLDENHRCFSCVATS